MRLRRIAEAGHRQADQVAVPLSEPPPTVGWFAA